MNAMTGEMMAGFPSLYLYVILFVSAGFALWSIFIPVSAVNSNRGYRFDLLQFSVIKAMVRWRGTQFILQAGHVFLLIAIIVTGLFGVQTSRNFAPVMTWTLWWALLVFDILIFGRSWCLVCPWYAIATWLKRLAFWRRTDEPLSLNIPWPKQLKNIYLAVILFLVLTWLELGFQITSNPQLTAVLALFMTTLVVFPTLIFEKGSFCKYGCLVGRICGTYSMMSPVEYRSKDSSVCVDCSDHECRNGSTQGYPCPSNLDLKNLEQNTYCLNCGECVRSCSRQNVSFNIRPFASDLLRPFSPKRDEALMAIILLAMSTFHGLTMTPTWDLILTGVQHHTGAPYLIAFTLGMVGILLLFLGSYAVMASVGQLSPVVNQNGMNLVTTAYALIPLALFYHLAHNGAHFLAEGGMVLVALADPFDLGWNLIGSTELSPSPLISQSMSWLIQCVFILGGFFYSLKVFRYLAPTGTIATRLFGTVLLGSYHLLNVWLLQQPMVMRSGM